MILARARLLRPTPSDCNREEREFWFMLRVREYEEMY